MTEGPVVYKRRNGVVTLRLNRPETLNAMNEAMMAEFERLLPDIAADATVRVVVLTGTGRAFSSGGDQKRHRGQDAERKFFDSDLGGGVVERLHRCIRQLQRLPKPVIASVNGAAVGAGCNLALAADLRIAADSARFGAFDLIDPALEGDGARAVRILRVLREEGVEPIHVLGSLTWAIRGVCGIAAGLEGGTRLDDVLRGGFGAWWRRKHIVQHALSRMPRRGWVRLLGVAEGVDRILKGGPARSGATVRWSRDDGWVGLERLALAMCRVKLPRAAPYN